MVNNAPTLSPTTADPGNPTTRPVVGIENTLPSRRGKLFRFYETVTDVNAGAETLRRRRYGVLEVREGKLHRILLRPYPKMTSLYEVGLASLLNGLRPARDRCLLYYNAPRGCPDYLTLRYLISDRGTSMKTIHTALGTLDEVARLRHADAIVCDAANPRLSHRLMERYGWCRHCEHLRGRHYIKRLAS